MTDKLVEETNQIRKHLKNADYGSQAFGEKGYDLSENQKKIGNIDLPSDDDEPN